MIEGCQLLGIVTQTDIVSAIDRGVAMDSPIAEIMVRNVVTIPGDMRLYEVIRRFKEQDIGRVIVTDVNDRHESNFSPQFARQSRAHRSAGRHETHGKSITEQFVNITEFPFNALFPCCSRTVP